MKKKYIALWIIMLCIIMTGCKNDFNEIGFINNSETTLLYKLGEDNINPFTEYPGTLTRIELDNNEFEYVAEDGSLRYIFSINSAISEKPIMTYAYLCNREFSLLFGIEIGRATYVEENKTLGILKSYSLGEFLIDNGYSRYYKENMSFYADEVRYTWQCFKNEKTYINFSTDVYVGGGCKLYSFEIGLI